MRAMLQVYPLGSTIEEAGLYNHAIIAVELKEQEQRFQEWSLNTLFLRVAKFDASVHVDFTKLDRLETPVIKIDKEIDTVNVLE